MDITDLSKGGHRWHARPAVNFLNNMAFELNVDKSSYETAKGDGSGPKFDPMRRKWH